MVSALKVGGRRLHELARAGIEVERAARAVTVSRFDVELADVTGDRSWTHRARWTWPAGSGGAGPVLAIDVVCSSGTYVRSLAADLGTALGGGAHLRRLRRLAVGSYGLEESVSLDALETMAGPGQGGPADRWRPCGAWPGSPCRGTWPGPSATGRSWLWALCGSWAARGRAVGACCLLRGHCSPSTRLTGRSGPSPPSCFPLRPVPGPGADPARPHGWPTFRVANGAGPVLTNKGPLALVKPRVRRDPF